jgi:hypothetical protein
VSTACCPRCRLVQAEAPGCAHCGDEVRPVRFDDELELLLKRRVEGVRTVPKKPATGWRDGLAVTVTALGVLGGAGAGAWLTRSPYGIFAGVALGAFGYSKQYWMARLVRRKRLRPVPFLLGPEPGGVVGVAQPFQRTIEAQVSGETALVAVVMICGQFGLLLRHVRAEPFWLLADDGARILVTGACWIGSIRARRFDSAGSTDDVNAALRVLGVPATLRLPALAAVIETHVKPGERVRVIGTVRREHAVEVAGYRDATVDVMRGVPGAPVWITRSE